MFFSIFITIKIYHYIYHYIGIVECVSYPRIHKDDIKSGTTEFSFTIPGTENDQL